MNKLVASCEFPSSIKRLTTCIEKLEYMMLLLWEIEGIIKGDVQSISSYVHSSNAAIQKIVLEVESITKIQEKVQNIQKHCKIAAGGIQAMTIELQAKKADDMLNLFTGEKPNGHK